MAVTTQDVYDVLKSIDRRLSELITLQRGNTKELAPASDLDGQYGDPVIRAKDPRDWSGESQLGKPFSECPAEYLDLVASRLDFFAEKAEADGTLTTSGKPVAPYNRRDAARARGWAARLRNGWKPQPKVEGFPSDSGQMVSDEDIAF